MIEEQSLDSILVALEKQLRLAPIDEDTLSNNLRHLYSSDRRLETKKGSWTIYEREDFAMPWFNPKEEQAEVDLPTEIPEDSAQEPRREFCAVYKIKENGRECVQQIIRGVYSSSEVVDTTIDYLTKNVLEKSVLLFKKGAFPEEAFSYEFPTDDQVVNEIEKEADLLNEQTWLTLRYAYLSHLGHSPSKDYFKRISDCLDGGISGEGDELETYIHQNPHEPEVPFRTLVHVFNAKYGTIEKELGIQE